MLLEEPYVTETECQFLICAEGWTFAGSDPLCSVSRRWCLYAI